MPGDGLAGDVERAWRGCALRPALEPRRGLGLVAAGPGWTAYCLRSKVASAPSTCTVNLSGLCSGVWNLR